MGLSLSHCQPPQQPQSNRATSTSNVSLNFPLTGHWRGLELTVMVGPASSRPTDAVVASRPFGRSLQISFQIFPKPTARNRPGRNAVSFTTWPTTRLEPVPPPNRASSIGPKPIKRSGTASFEQVKTVCQKSPNSTPRTRTWLSEPTGQSRTPCIWR